MYCYKCGKQIEDNSVICPYCGTALSQRPTQQTSEDPFGRPENSSAGNNAQYGQNSGNAPNYGPNYYGGYNQGYNPNNGYGGEPVRYGKRPAPDDARSVGWGFLCFLIPILGLILFIVWKDEYPQRAKSCGIGALVSVILGVAITVLSYVIIIAMAAASSTAVVVPVLPLM